MDREGPGERMLDAFIIEEIKRRDRGAGRDERPALELPLPAPAEPAPGEAPGDDPKPPGGVVIIDYTT
jgi:hypothetical protein